jgi:hypothetical protein
MLTNMKVYAFRTFLGQEESSALELHDLCSARNGVHEFVIHP